MNALDTPSSPDERATHMLDGQSGTVLRTILLGGTEMTVDGTRGLVFVINLAGRLYVLDAQTGSLLHATSIDQGASAIVVDEHSGHVFISSRGPSSHGMLIRGYGEVSIIAAHSGAVLRAVTLGPDQVPGTLAVSEALGRVFVAETDDMVGVLDAHSGAVLHTIRVGQYPQDIAVDPRTRHVFVANTYSDSVNMLDARTGAVLRTVPVGFRPVGLAVNSPGGRVFVVNNGDNTVSMLDARSGTILRTTPVGQDPSEVTADAVAGHAFVELAHGVRMLDATSGQTLPTR
jgi:YVTN family beta-propeller protein